jgi:DNA-binding HxlR family transcriptional regulator
LVGDRWTILLVRELSLGSTRFDQLLTQTGATPQMLTSRLRRLEADGMIVREPYSQRPLRHEYRLTAKGRDFIPVLFAFRAFGEKWCKAEAEPMAVRTFHRECGGEVGLDGECTACHAQVPFRGLQVAPSQAYVDERRGRAGA